MTTLIDVMRQPSIAALAWALIHFLWQGALLGGIAFVILRAGRPQRAATRYAIGVTTLALMLVTCAATFVLVARQQSATPRDSIAASAFAHALGRDTSTATFAPATATPPAAQQLIADAVGGRHPSTSSASSTWRLEPLGPTALLVIVMAWAIGVFAMTLRLIGGWMLTRRLATRAAIAVSPSIDAAARAIARRLEIRRAVAILESGAVVVPTLVGWLKPVVLLPAAALAGLSPEQLEAVLAHELAHVRRHDYLVNLLQSMVETLLFYHPATWWVSAQIRAEREHCCDDLAVEVCGDRLVYASALAELTTLAGHRGLALAATDGSLLNRVQRILGSQRSMQEPAPAWPLLALVVLVAGAGATGATSAAGATSVTSAADVTSTATVASAADGDQIAAIEHAEADQARAEASQAAALVAQLREQAEWLTREAARLRAEADMIRQSDAQLRGSTWLGDWIDAPPPPPPPPAPAESISPPPPPPAPPTAGVLDVAAPEAPPPAPAAPPAPPAPPSASAREGSSELRRDLAETASGREGGQDLGSRGSGNMSWSNNGEKFSVKWTGAFRLSDDEKGIDWVEDGATVTVTDGLILVSRVELRGKGGSVERNYWQNGTRRDYEPEGRLFLAAAIEKLIRHSGAFAKERVARFLKSGGADAVLAEIDRLADSSYVRRVYYTELLKQAPPSDALLGRVLQRVPTELKSDYDKATLLTQAAQSSSMTDTHRVAIARAVKTISSDYDQRRTLTAILTTKPLAALVAAAVLEATASIRSNYDRSQVLVTVAESGGLTPATTPAFMEQVRSMTSSYDQRRVLTAVSANSSLADVVGVEAVRTVGAMTSSHDQSTTLISLIERGGLTEASAPAFFESAARISSSHDLSRVLRKVVERPASSDRMIEGVLRIAPKVSSGHDRANVLIDVAARGRLSGEARQLYIAASKGLSSHDENRALAALVRTEGPR
jgi:beta-lactamase regulating signal transducer with metallopeptidase domain